MARSKKFGKLKGNRKNIAKNAKRIKENIEILKKLK
jgi:hypothetical protein